ncbi:hypothetical protein SPLC1_S370730 [Arthrospira platensis C1]|nr:hypothetical protein SPLC1_S370730 [Arthrospira platensis C1]
MPSLLATINSHFSHIVADVIIHIAPILSIVVFLGFY